MSRGVHALATFPGIRRGTAAPALALLTTAALGLMAGSARAEGPRPPARQPLVTLLRDHVVRAAPSVRAPSRERVSARRPLTRVRTVLPLLDTAVSSDGRGWVKVRLPGRPNGHSGWIPQAHTRRGSTSWSLAVTLATRRLVVFYEGRVARRFSVIVGKRATPTPAGRFSFIEEAVRLGSSQAGGPFALATSARSSVYQEFDGGPGQIALHGTNNLGGALGTAASHGCVRLSPRAITWLARRIGAGVPLRVTQR